jgi:hypothetical protein
MMAASWTTRKLQPEGGLRGPTVVPEKIVIASNAIDWEFTVFYQTSSGWYDDPEYLEFYCRR